MLLCFGRGKQDMPSYSLLGESAQIAGRISRATHLIPATCRLLQNTVPHLSTIKNNPSTLHDPMI